MLADLFGSRAVKIDGITLSSNQIFEIFGASAKTTAGVTVTDAVARNYSLFRAAVNVQARAIAVLPLRVYQRLDRGRQEDPSHFAYPLLRNSPNPQMTSIAWRERVFTDLLSSGNSFNRLTFGGRGRVSRIDPLPADRMEVKADSETGELIYKLNPDGSDAGGIFRPEEVLHVPYIGTGVMGANPVSVNGQALGTMIAADEYAGGFFGNGLRIPGFMKTPGTLDEPTRARILEKLNERHGGSENAWKMGLLEGGMDFIATGVPPETAQLLETRKYSVLDMCRIFGMPPHKLQHLEDAHHTNIEASNIEWVQETLMSLAERLEQELHRKVLDGRAHFAKHDFRSLLRGDTAARTEYSKTGVQWGWLTRNEAREDDDRNPLEGLDEPMVPLNMGASDQLGDVVSDSSTSQPGFGGARSLTPRLDQIRGGDEYQSIIRRVRLGVAEKRSIDARNNLRDSHMPLFLQGMEKIVRREVGRIEKAVGGALANGGEQEFREWMDDFYLDHRDFFSTTMGPIIGSYVQSVAFEAFAEVGRDLEEFENDIGPWGEGYVEIESKLYTESSARQLSKMLEEEAPAESIAGTLEKWTDKRAQEKAFGMAVDSQGAISRWAYIAAGVVSMRWVTGKGCPMCSRMSGKIVSTHTPFLAKSETLNGDDGHALMTTRRSIRHPPLHRGCDCSVVAVTE